MKLFFSPFSPFVRKCLVVARELGIDRQIELLPAAASPVKRDLSISNPLGKIPALLTEEGEVLVDSRVICEYLNQRAQGSLYPENSKARYAALTLQALADGIMDAAVLVRYENAIRPEALRWAEWQAGQLDKIESALAHINSHTPANNEPLHIGLLTLGCALWYLDLRYPTLGWRERHSALAAWYAGFGGRESMKASWALAG